VLGVFIKQKGNIMSDDSMQWSKTKSGSKPEFNHVRYGDAMSRIGAIDNPSGGEVRPEKFINGPNSSRVTDRLGNPPPANKTGV
jgi:hypothetical protein